MRVFVDASLLIYLNVKTPEEFAKRIENFWRDLLRYHELYTDILVLDETIYVSKKKYGVTFSETIKFIDRVVTPFIEIVKIDLDEYRTAKDYIVNYELRPSDAIHIAVIVNYSLDAVASEDKDFEKAGIKRLWI